MRKIKAIIVDDEASARENLELLVNRFCPTVEILGTFDALLPAVDFLKSHTVDVVFSDVEMPEHAGYEIVDFFETMNFDIIFCTAYDRYAIKAFDLSALDYLLKPIDVSRLKQACKKLEEKQLFKTSKEQINTINSSFRNTLKVMEKGERVLIPKSSIIAIEGQSAYSKIYTQQRSYTASKNMAQLEEELKNEPFFYRIQKSWMINLDRIVSVNKTEKMVFLENDITAKISRQKAKEFYSLINM